MTENFGSPLGGYPRSVLATRLLDKINQDMRAAIDCDPKAQRGLSMQALDDLLL